LLKNSINGYQNIRKSYNGLKLDDISNSAIIVGSGKINESAITSNSTSVNNNNL